MTPHTAGGRRERGRARRAPGVGLRQLYGITAADLTTLQHRGVNPNVRTIVLGCCTQDTRILWEISLREPRHHAAGAGTSDAQANGIPDREHLPDPGILHEILRAVRSLHIGKALSGAFVDLPQGAA